MISLSKSYEECRLLNRHYGTRFFHVFSLLPKEAKPHIDSLYAYDRIMLEIMHRPRAGVSKAAQLKALQAWKKAFDKSLDEYEHQNVYLHALSHTVKMYDLPPALVRKLAKTRITEYKRKKFDSYLQLRRHCHTVSLPYAEAVSTMLQMKDSSARKTLHQLLTTGELLSVFMETKTHAMAGKCYFPRKDMKKFGYGIKKFQENIVDESFIKMTEHYLEKLQKDIEKIRKKITLFPENHRELMTALTQTYAYLIKEIRKKEYNLFTQQPQLGISLRMRHYLPALGSFLRS